MIVRANQCGIIISTFVLALMNGCARHPADLARQEQIIVVQKGRSDSLEQTMAPVFQLIDAQKTYNRIGQVFATGTKSASKATINPDNPVVYVGTRQFKTAKSCYINLIYRVHFLEQPYSLIPFNYGAGQHVGLLVILTLDQAQQVVLVTTVQTCGCYAVTIPTKALPKSAYPANWPSSMLNVAGERLPSQLPSIGSEDVLQVVIRPEVHRVMNMKVVPKSSLANGVVSAKFADLASLKNLPLEDGTSTSFYYRNWPLSGHVKGAIKPWETLLLGLISFDLFVGMDKEFGDTHESGNPFYTSLKPWNRRISDLNNFESYLRFNEWSL